MCTKIIFIFCLHFCVFYECVSSDNITFRNIDCKWSVPSTFSHNVLAGVELRESNFRINSSNSLKGCLKNASCGITVVLSGTIPTLYKDSVRDISCIKILAISNVGLEEIQPGAFSNLSLFKLTLSGNKLTKIRSGVFENLDIGIINLENNKISVLESGAFRNLPNVRTLDLNTNQLKNVRSGAFRNVSLLWVDLGANLLSNIEAGLFKGLLSPGPDTIMLPSNHLQEIDPKVFDNKNTEQLFLDENLISEVRPGDLDNLPSLEVLSLYGNKFEEVRNGAFKSNLSLLNLGGNIISKIGDRAFENLPNLKTLFLDYNKLTTIQGGFNPGLIRLSLRRNEISHIDPGAFEDMKNFKYLTIDHNRLESWDSNWFHCSKEPEIQVSYNKFSELPDSAFKHCPQVKAVFLEGNKLKKIEQNAFDGVTHIGRLSLARNEIEEWNLNQLPNISVLDLSNNKMKCDKWNTIIFESVDRVILRGNLFDENCILT